MFRKVIAEVSAPLSQVKKVTMVSSGGAEVGASKMTDEVMTIVTKVPDMVKTLTGVDIAKVTTELQLTQAVNWVCLQTVQQEVRTRR